MDKKEYMFFTADASMIVNKISNEIYYYFITKVELEFPKVAEKLPSLSEYKNNYKVLDSIEIRKAMSNINRAEFLIGMRNVLMEICDDYRKIYYNWITNTDENNIDLDIVPKLSVDFIFDCNEVNSNLEIPYCIGDLWTHYPYVTKEPSFKGNLVNDIFLPRFCLFYDDLCEDICRYVEIAMIIYPLNIVINNLHKYIHIKVQDSLDKLDSYICQEIRYFIHEVHEKFLCSKENKNPDGDEIVLHLGGGEEIFLERYDSFIEENEEICTDPKKLDK